MKQSLKKITVTTMSGLLLATTVLPVFAQDYSYDSYDSGYDYSYQQTNQTQNTNQYQYQNQNYQQQSYPQQNNYPAPAYNRPQQPPQSYNTVPVQNNYNLPPLQGRVVSVPPGTMIPGAIVNRTISSKNLRTGDSISVNMSQPFYYAGSLVLPAGSNILGTVVMAEPAGRAGKNGQLMIVFNQAITPSGQRMGMTGKLATEDGSGVLKGGTAMDRTKEVVKDTAVGAGVGALLGTIFGAISGGSAGKGAAIGTAIGGGSGVAKTVIDKGKDVVIEVGQQLDIILDSELRTGGEENSSPVPSNFNTDYNYGY